MALASEISENEFILLMPMIESRMKGQNYKMEDPLYTQAARWAHVTSPTPVSAFLTLWEESYNKALLLIHKKAIYLLRDISEMDDETLRNLVHRMQSIMMKFDHLQALSQHVCDDKNAIFAVPGNPSEAVFHPENIIDCKGVGAICKDDVEKSKFLNKVNEHIAMTPEQRAAFMENYSIIRRITAEECQKDHLPDVMLGQKGVFARYDLPKHFFLGFYSGTYFDDPEEAFQYSQKVGAGYEAYLFDFSTQDRPITSAFMAGNRISLINSATNYTGTAEEIAHYLFYIQNCLPICLKTDNNPNPDIRDNPDMFDISGYVTTRPVKKGEQLYVDYGYNYWRNKNNNFTKASDSDIDAEYLRLKDLEG
ncbi:MAG: SET domain-containing protein-lysine N-methyltransferase [Pseudomonadota bacterium]